MLVMEDLRIPHIIPPEPDLPILIENDEDPPLSFGFEECEALRRREWIEMRPHRAAFRNSSTTATATATTPLSQGAKEEGMDPMQWNTPH